MPKQPKTCLTQQYHKSLIIQFQTTLATWQHTLFGPIHKLQPTNQLLYACQAKETISIVSNASVQKNKQSGFAWIISHHKQNLWKGMGLAPGNADDMYLGCAEAFGMSAVLTFLQYHQFNNSPLHCFCDNLGIITTTAKMLTQTITQPNDATNDARDIYLAFVMQYRNAHHSNLAFFMFWAIRIKT